MNSIPCGKNFPTKAVLLKCKQLRWKKYEKHSFFSSKEATALFQETMEVMMSEHSKKDKSVEKELKDFENMNIESDGEDAI